MCARCASGSSEMSTRPSKCSGRTVRAICSSSNGERMSDFGNRIPAFGHSRIAATTATFHHPEIAFGDVVYGPLHDLVGGAVARDLCLTGRKIDSDEALRVGLVSAVVSPATVLEVALERASAIASAPRDVLLRMKVKIARRAGITPGATLDL